MGVSFEGDDGQAVVLSAIASRSFAAEYLPGQADADLLTSISSNTGGRGEITADVAFDPGGLEPGISERTFRWLFLLLAALLWPIDVALRRLRLSARDGRPRRGKSAERQATPTTPVGARTH